MDNGPGHGRFTPGEENLAPLEVILGALDCGKLRPGLFGKKLRNPQAATVGMCSISSPKELDGREELVP